MEYKHRINELQQELEEAERFNDAQRKTEIQNELQAICHNLASAVGLGGEGPSDFFRRRTSTFCGD